MITIKHIGAGALVLCMLWAGSGIYNYFFDTTIPQLSLRGIEQHGFYAGDMNCTIACTKAGEISLWLDNQPLAQKFKISPNEQGHPLNEDI